MAKNPFTQLDATLTPKSIQAIVYTFSEIALSLKRCWSSMTPAERDVILSSAEDIGSKLAMGAVTSAAMGGDMDSIIAKLKTTLSKSSSLTAIFEAIKSRG